MPYTFWPRGQDSAKGQAPARQRRPRTTLDCPKPARSKQHRS